MSNLTLDSMASPTKSPRLRRKGLAVLLLATGAAVVFLPARRANAFLFDIVLDPIALVENVLKVVDLGEQIDADRPSTWIHPTGTAPTSRCSYPLDSAC